MSQVETEYKKPLVHQSPTYCHGSGCAVNKACVRYRPKGLFIGIDVWRCTRTDHCFQLVEGSLEAQEFRRQEKLHTMEAIPFSLRKDYTIPTNTSMYECFFCVGAGKEYRIEDHRTPDYMKTTWDTWEKMWPSTIRVCSGCGRYDGPWVPYGND